MHYYAKLLLLTIALSAHAASWATPRVVASIKPVHSLLSNIMQGVAEPALLMATSQSPHHYSLKPSERRLLAQADMIFWIGPGLESFMPRLLTSLDNKTQVVTLIESRGLVLLPQRSRDEHGHDHHDSRHDPHIWLHTHNIELMAGAITRALVSADPTHKLQYEDNHEKLRQRIRSLRTQLHQQLENQRLPFLTYHDAYQYFEQEFGLNNAGFVSAGSEAQPGAGHIRALKKQIEQQSITCIFYDAPVKPPVLKTLLADSHAQAVALDATGLTFAAGKENLFQSMASLGQNIGDCLRKKL